MKCDFIDRLLELGAVEFKRAISKKENADHISTCKVCAKAVKVRSDIDDALTGLSPDKSAIGRIKAGLKAELAKSPKPLRPEKSSFISPSGIMAIVLAVLAVAGSIVALFLHNSRDEGTVIRKHEIPAHDLASATNIVGRNMFSPNRLVKLQKNETSVLELSGGRQVTLSGAGSLQVSDSGDIRMHDGKLRMAFSHSALGYKILLPTVILAIRGTTIEIEFLGETQIVKVIEGTIEWMVSASQERGELHTGEGVQVKDNRVEALDNLQTLTKTANGIIPEKEQPVASGLPGAHRTAEVVPEIRGAPAGSGTSLIGDGVIASSASGATKTEILDNHKLGRLDDGF
ncbi:MAG: hypothetical protein HQM09_03790 [Candidatus Riflebacteria bacterium]|nr:hypothetical protein [Candidatus Riflebacteria bacterium]